jgi:hypothetical protein
MIRAVRARFAVSLLSILCVTLTAFAAVGDEKLGKGVTLAEAIPIKALYDTPEKFAGKTIRVDGVVSAVCEAMGCWMALADPKDAALVVRFKVDHDAGIVFPLSARGKAASAEGIFEKIAAGDAEGREAATEQAAGSSNPTAFAATYHVKATGAVIK